MIYTSDGHATLLTSSMKEVLGGEVQMVDTEQWWVSIDGGDPRPTGLDRLREWILTRQVRAHHQVKKGDLDWVEARLAPALRPAFAELRKLDRDRKMNFFLTTETTLSDYDVVRRIEVITSECAFGMNVFRDFFAGIRDVVGGRSTATQKVLKDARRTCLHELRREALELGADAVIGVDLDYSEFSGGGKSMLFLVASGTAVVLRKRES